MSDIVLYGVSRAAELLAELQLLSSADLRVALQQQLRDTAAHLLRLAVMVRILEERGEDLSEMKLGMLDYLRQIAYGQILPEVVVRFASYPMLIQRIVRLPLPEQAKLGSGEAVPFHFRREDSTPDVRMIDPMRLPAKDIKRVFGSGRIRSQAEQLLLADQDRQPVKSSSPQRGAVRANKQNSCLVVGRTMIDSVDVLAALADLSDAGSDAEVTGASVHVPVALTQAEHQHLKILAVRRNTSMSDIIRQALRATGLLRTGGSS